MKHRTFKVSPLKVDRTIAQLSTQSSTASTTMTNSSTATTFTNINERDYATNKGQSKVVSLSHLPNSGTKALSSRSSSTSSISSVDSDDLGAANLRDFNIWDNSEMRLRGIDTQEFVDYYGKPLTFLQLFKLRSYFYSKPTGGTAPAPPSLGKIFKDAERIAKFCQMSFKVDDFLEENKQAQTNLICIDFNRDKNAQKFLAFFDTTLETNTRKSRPTQYDRYSMCSPTRRSTMQATLTSPLKKQHQQSVSMSGLNLSPRKLLKKQHSLAAFADGGNKFGSNATTISLSSGGVNLMTTSVAASAATPTTGNKRNLNMLELNQLHKSQKLEQVKNNGTTTTTAQIRPAAVQSLKKQQADITCSPGEEDYSPLPKEIVNLTKQPTTATITPQTMTTTTSTRSQKPLRVSSVNRMLIIASPTLTAASPDPHKHFQNNKQILQQISTLDISKSENNQSNAIETSMIKMMSTSTNLSALRLTSVALSAPPLLQPQSPNMTPANTNKKTSEFRLKLLTTQTDGNFFSDATVGTPDSNSSGNPHKQNKGSTPISSSGAGGAGSAGKGQKQSNNNSSDPNRQSQQRFFSQKSVGTISSKIGLNGNNINGGTNNNNSSSSSNSTAALLKKTQFDSPLIYRSSNANSMTQSVFQNSSQSMSPIKQTKLQVTSSASASQGASPDTQFLLLKQSSPPNLQHQQHHQPQQNLIESSSNSNNSVYQTENATTTTPQLPLINCNPIVKLPLINSPETRSSGTESSGAETMSMSSSSPMNRFSRLKPSQSSSLSSSSSTGAGVNSAQSASLFLIMDSYSSDQMSTNNSPIGSSDLKKSSNIFKSNVPMQTSQFFQKHLQSQKNLQNSVKG